MKKINFFLLLISFTIAILVFLKNGWVTEDAYIIFRSLEQLFAGNGPVWNPHERVQVYTSPLWYLVLALARLFSSDVYLNAIVVSFILWLFTVLTLKVIFKNNSILFMSILLFSASTAFFDFTSSGLENVLAYFLITIYILNYLALFIFDNDLNQRIKSTSRIKALLLLFGLIIGVRHDLALLLLPPTLYVVLKHSKIFSTKQWIVFSFVALLPFILYSLFSLIYYGFPFPNTAYAKLNTGIDKIELLRQGGQYFHASFRYDTITLLVIISALVLSFFKSSEKCLNYLGYGVIFNLLYIGYVGGDFMQGRFLSYAYLVSVILLLLRFTKTDSFTFKLLTFLVVCSYLVWYPHTPFNSPFNYSNSEIKMGVADERGFYFHQLSLYSYIFHDKGAEIFPNHAWAKDGRKFKESSNQIAIWGAIGLFGYYAGTEKIILDPLALSDPLLARLTVTDEWRIGHFPRKIPKGYIESIIDNNEVIVNPQLNEFYKKIKIITQNDSLFTLERLKIIILFNIGAYNHLLQQ